MIRIMVDTSADYTVEETKEKGIGLLPIHITMGDKDYRDAYDLTKEEFYNLLTGSSEFPKTAQPSLQDLLDAFEEAKENGDELIYITLSSALSGTYQSAVLAKNMAEYDKIYLVDSLTATHMVRVLADYAKKLADEGVSAEKIVEELEDLKGRVKVYAALDTLEYLYKGGRLSKTSAVLGEMARIKPLITVNANGEVAVVGKCMGKNKAITTLMKMIGDSQIDPDFPRYSVYTQGLENSDIFENRVRESGIEITERYQIGATIGAHIGPGVFGLIFVEKSRKSLIL